MKRFVGCLIVLVILIVNVVAAQRLTPNASFVLNLDYAKFRNDDSSGYLEIYFGFYSRLLTYERQGEGYEGFVRLWTKIRSKETGGLVVNDLSPLRFLVRDTSDASFWSARVTQMGYALPHGDYILEVVAGDSLAPARKDSIKLAISMKPIGTSVISSDLQLCSSVKNSENKADPFYKNSLEVMPNPTLVFGANSYPMMFNYSELYNLDPQQTYTVKSQVVAPDGKILKEASKSRKYGVQHAVEAGMTNVAAIQSGKYRFRLVIGDESGKSLSQSEKSFFVYNPHIQVSQPAAASLKASELAGLSADELADEFRRAQYVATDQEIKTFSQVSNADGRRELLAKFWVEVEGGRLGRAGISRTTYLQRVSSANQRFRVLSREGWRTDRGRVFVLYAEPDEIERYPSSEQSKPYEIWHYYAIENGVDFVFVDRSGFGDYILVHSTKRGELRDETWQRFLQ